MSEAVVVKSALKVTMPDTVATDTSLTGLDDAVAGKTTVASWIRETAHFHRVSFAETPFDAFSAAVSRLFDAGVQPDQTEQLLLGLFRAGIVTDVRRFALHAAYLRQSRT
jgi:hypothetical protein